jgi:PST family polysaccharide transporter
VFGVNILLMRLLGPAPFGQVAVAMLLFSFGNLVASVGVGSALIQSAEIDDRDIRFCFTSQMIVGVTVSLLLALSSPLWAAFFHQPELTLLLRCFAPVIAFQSFGTASSAVLSRRLNTRAIQICTLASYSVAFLGVAVPMALLGKGVWSLVCAYLVQSSLNSLLLYIQVRHSLAPLLHRDGTRFFRFGLSILGGNLCNWSISNLDNTFVGRFSGPVQLGLYSRAFNLAQMPADNIIVNLQQVLLPAFSRVQKDTKRLARVYLAACGLAALVVLPAFCAMAVVPGTIILGLYGAKWAGAIYLFQPLALAMPLQSLMALAGPTIASRGKPQVEMKLQFVVALLAIPAFCISVHYSVLCLSWTVLAVYVVRFTLLTGAVLRETGAKWMELLHVTWPAMFLAGVSAATAVLLNLFLPIVPMWLRLAIVVCGTGFLTVAVLGICRSVLLRPIFRNSPQLRDILQAKISSAILDEP